MRQRWMPPAAAIRRTTASARITVRRLMALMMAETGTPGGSFRTEPRSGQRHQVGVAVVPEVLVAVGQQQHPVRLERPDGTLVVGDQDDRALVGADRGQHLLAGG